MKKNLLFKVFLLCTCSMIFVIGAGAQTNSAVDDVISTGPLQKIRSHVVENDGVPCSNYTLEIITGLNPVSQGIATVLPDGFIEFTPGLGCQNATVQIRYRISCTVWSSEATLTVHVAQYNSPVNEIPNNTECISIMEEGVAFAPTLKYVAGGSSKWALDGFSMPLVGDLNNDGKPEIVALGLDTRDGTTELLATAGRILIFNGQTGSEIGRWTLPDGTFPLRYEPRHNSVSKLAMADLDRDGIAEIILTSTSGYIYCLKPVYDINGNPSTYTIPWSHNSTSESFKQPLSAISMGVYGSPTPYIADINGDGNPEVVVYNKIYNAINGNLVCTLEELNDFGYTTSSSTNTTIHNTYAFVGRRPGAAWIDRHIPCMSIVDINGDGILDIVAGSKAYIMKDNNGIPALDRIIHGPTSVTAQRGNGSDTGTYTCQVNDGFTAVADVDGNGILDVIVFAPAADALHNYTQSLIYVWEPMSSTPNTPKAATYLYTQSYSGTHSFPFIGDINGRADNWSANKKLPEICVNTGRLWALGGYSVYPTEIYAGSKLAVHPLSTTINLNDASFNANNTPDVRGHVLAFTYHADPNGSTPLHQRLKLSWVMEHKDESSCTGITMFDFDNDGVMELCYRDETTLRVISPGGKTPAGQYKDLVKNTDTPSSIPQIIRFKQTGVRSYTGFEASVIADVNMDGSADIVTMANDATFNANNTASNPTSKGYVYVFEHASGSDAWAPCPPVWNQAFYFPLQINENLTVPAKTQSILTSYTKNGEQIQPFNGHWIQQPIVRAGDDYRPVVRHPDAVIRNMEVKVLNASSTQVNLLIYNKGTASIAASAPISFYNGGVTGNPLSGSSFIVSNSTGLDIFPNETATLTYTLSGNFNNCLIWARIMANNTEFPVNGYEDCNLTNNTMSGIDCPYLDVKTTAYPSTVICGNNGVVKLSVTAQNGGKFNYQGTPTFQWYKNDVEFAGKTDSVLIVSEAGLYSCMVIDGICRKKTQDVNVTVDNTKNIDPLVLSATPAGGFLCTPAGQVVITVGNPESYTAPIKYTWYKDEVYQSSPIGDTYNATTAGTYRLLLASNTCMTTNSFAVVQTTNAGPSIGNLSAIPAVCVGTAPVLTVPQVTENGCTVTSQGWQISTSSGGSTFINFDPSTNLVLGDNGKLIRYYAVNDCGTSYSTTVVIAMAVTATVAVVEIPSAICDGGSLSLNNPSVTSNGGAEVTSGSWQIETAAGSGSYSDISMPYPVSLSDNGKKIRYRATNACGNGFSNEVSVTVNPIPVPTLTGPDNAVNGQADVIYTTQPGMNNYQWTINGGTITSGGGNTNEATVTWGLGSSGKITVTYSSPNGCPAAVSVVKDVALGGQSTASITGSLSVCPLTVYEYTTESGKYNYEWTITGGTPQGSTTGSNKVSVLWNGSTSPSVKVSYRHQDNPGLPKVEVTESAIAKQKITTITAPPAGATVCYNESHTMTVEVDCEGGTASYQWEKDGSSVGGNSASYPATATGNYAVTVTGVCGSAASTPVRVTVKDQPVAELLGQTSAFETEEAAYTAGAPGSNYNWNYGDADLVSGGTGNTIKVKWTTQGTKNISVSYLSDGCPTNTARIEVNVTQQGEPFVDPSVFTPDVCFNELREYTAGETDKYNYKWTVTQGGQIEGRDDQPSVWVKWGSAGVGKIKVAYSATSSSEVKESPEATITIYGKPNITTPVTAPSGVCNNTLLTLSAPGVISSLSYTSGWKLNGADFLPSTPVTYAQNGYSLYYRAESLCGVTETTPVQITVYPVPVAGSFQDITLCSGTLQPEITPSGGSNVSYYTWNGGASVGLGNYSGTDKLTISSFTASGVSSVTDAAVRVTPYYKSNGTVCDGTSTSFNVKVNPLPFPTITGPEDAIKGQSGVVYTTETGMIDYDWTIAGGEFISGGDGNYMATVKWNDDVSQGTISVTYKSAAGCAAASSTSKRVNLSDQGVPVITGSTTVCPLTVYTYKTETGKSNYAWTVTNGDIKSGQNTNEITVEWYENATGEVSVSFRHQNDPGVPLVSKSQAITMRTVTRITAVSAGATVCYGNSHQMTVTALGESLSYEWKNGTTTVGVGSSYTATATGNYTVTVNGLCGSETSSPVGVTVKTQPVATLSSDVTSAVTTQEVIYTAGSGSNYTWSYPGATYVSGGTSTDNTLTVSWPTTGAKTVKVSYVVDGCPTTEAGQSIPVNTQGQPGTDFGVDLVAGGVCFNSQGTYSTESDKYNYKWTVTGGSIQSGEHESTVVVKWGVVGTGTIKVAYSAALSSQAVESAPVSFTIHNKPTVGNITAPAAICNNTELSLTPPAVTSSKIYTGAWKLNDVNYTDGNLTYAADNGHELVYEATNACGTTASNKVPITVKNVPTATLSSDVTSAVTTQAVTYTAGSGSNYTWTYPGATYVSGGTGTDNTLTVSWPTTGTKTVKVSYVVDGCPTTEADQSITVNSQGQPGTDFGDDLAANGVCLNTTASYTTDTPGYNYQWTVTGGRITGGEHEQTVTVTWNVAGQGSIKVAYGEASTSEVIESEVVTFAIHSLDATITGPSEAVTTQHVTYTAGSGRNYVWTIGDATLQSGGGSADNITVSWSSAGNKELKVRYTTPEGCQSEESVQTVAVRDQNKPGSNFAVGLSANGVCQNTTASYTTDTPGYNYRWTVTGGRIESGATDRTAIITWNVSGQGSIRVAYSEDVTATPVSSDEVTFAIHPVSATISGLSSAVTTQQVSYTAGSGSNYTWTVGGSDAVIVSGGGNTDNITVSWSVSGDKSVKVKYVTPDGCLTEDAIQDVRVREQGRPGSNFGNDLLANGVCVNTTASYTTDTEGYNYQWTVTGGKINGSSTSRTVNVTWEVAGQGTIKVAYGESSSSEVVESNTVTFVIHSDVATISGFGTAVTTQSVTYTAGPGSNYVWSVPDTGTDATIVSGGDLGDQTITVSWISAGMKSLEVSYTTPKGCRTSPKVQNVSVSAQGQPGTDFGVDLAANGVCLNTTADYTTDTEGYNYQWTVTGGRINGSSTSRTVNVTWNVVGQGTIKVSYGESAQSTPVESNTVSFSIHSLESTLTGLSSAVTTQRVTYTAGSGSNYLWTVPGLGSDAAIESGGESGDNTITVSWLSSGDKIVKVKYTTPAGCQSEEVTKEITVTAQGQPGTNFGVDLAANGVCLNTTASYTTDTEGYNYQWTVTGGKINGSSTSRTVNVTWNVVGQGTIKVSYGESPESTPVESNTVTFMIHSLDAVLSGLNSAVTTQSVTYTAGSGSNYLWTVSGSDAVIEEGGESGDNTVRVSWSSSGTKGISVSYTTSHGCQTGVESKSVNVKFQDQPGTDFGVDLAAKGVCLNTTASYTTDTEGYNYLWTVTGGKINGSSTSRTVNVTWNVVGQGTIKVSYGESPESTPVESNTVTFMIHSLDATITGLADAVTTQRVTYTAGLGSNYVWTVSDADATVVSGGSPSDKVTVWWSNEGTKHVKVQYTTPEGCLSEEVSRDITVTAQGSPGTGFGDDLAANGICKNTTASYTTDSEGYNYLWTITGGKINYGERSRTVNITWTGTGQGTIKVSYGAAATSDVLESPVVTFDIHPVESTIIGPSTAVTTQQVTYTAGSGSNYLWTIPDAGGDATIVSGGSGENTVTVSWLSSGNKTLKVQYTTPKGCQSEEAVQGVSVSAQGQPGTDFGVDLATNGVCLNTTASYTADTEGYNYLWTVTGGKINGSSTSRTVNVTWNVVGQGTIKVAYGESALSIPVESNTVTFDIHSLEATVSGPSSALTTQQVTYTAGSGNNYVWTVPDLGSDAAIVSGGGSGENTVTIFWLSSGDKSVKVKYTTPKGCQSEEVTKEVTVTAQGQPGTDFGVNLVADGECFNSQGTYSTESGKYNYQWTVTGGSISSGEHAATVVVNWGVAGTGTIKVAYSEDPAAAAVESNLVTFTIHNKPETPIISAPDAVCDNSPLNLTAPAVSSTKPVLSEGWKLNGVSYTGGNVTYAQDHGHSLVYEATNVCGSTESLLVPITVYDIPAVTVTVSTQNICPGAVVDLESLVNNPNGYTLTFYSTSSASSPLLGTLVSPSVPSVYYVEARNSGGCPSAVRVPINIGMKTTTRITGQPVVPSQIGLNNYFSLTVTAVGENLQYEWYKDNVAIDVSTNPSAATATLTVGPTTRTDDGSYYVIVTGDCGTAKTSTPIVVSVLSTDATLKDLLVNGVSIPNFDPQVTEYVYSVTCDVERANIIGIPNHPNATVVNQIGYVLEPGDNEFSIVVTAENGYTRKTYSVNVIRDCYIPKIIKDLEDTIICIGESHTFEVIAEGENLTYEWYHGGNRIWGANSNTYTVTNSKLSDYERYYVIIRSNFNGYKASAYSKNVRLWIAEYLPENLYFATYPDPAVTGKTYYIKVAGYSDVTKYTWSYSKEGVIFSPEEGIAGENETWATFGTLSEGAGTLTVTMEHPCGTRELSQNIRVKYPTGAEDVAANTVQVYPNPTTGILKVTNTQENRIIRIMDVTGALKGTYQAQEGTTTIDLTGYAKGTYMVQYNDKSYKVIKK